MSGLLPVHIRVKLIHTEKDSKQTKRSRVMKKFTFAYMPKQRHRQAVRLLRI